MTRMTNGSEPVWCSLLLKIEILDDARQEAGLIRPGDGVGII